jgi:hypothetical protein
MTDEAPDHIDRQGSLSGQHLSYWSLILVGVTLAVLRCHRLYSLARALTVTASWPAAGPTLALLQFLLGAADPAFARLLLLGIFDPANELIAGQRCDVIPSLKRDRVG